MFDASVQRKNLLKNIVCFRLKSGEKVGTGVGKYLFIF